jgi:hypothetical protein
MGLRDRIQGRLPARLCEAPAFAPAAGALPAAVATELQEALDASAALSAALRDVDATLIHDTLLVRSSQPSPDALPNGTILVNRRSGVTGVVVSSALDDTTTSPPVWRYTVTGMADTRLGDVLGALGYYEYGLILTDIYPGASAYLAGLARIVGERRGPTDPDALTRARVLARAAANSSWGRIADLLTAGQWLFDGPVYLDDGGEEQSAVSPWGTGVAGNGTVLLESLALAGISELHYGALLRIVRTARPAGVRLLVGALLGRSTSPFTFATVTLHGTETVADSIAVGDDLRQDSTTAAGTVLSRSGSGSDTTLVVTPYRWTESGGLPGTWGTSTYAYTAALDQFLPDLVTYHGSTFGDSSGLYSLEAV